MSIEQELKAALLTICDRSRTECCYDPSYFRREIHTQGALVTAKHLLMSSVSEGFIKLLEKDRLDLTLEATVLQPKYRELFSEEEIATARSRLPAHLVQEIEADTLATKITLALVSSPRDVTQNIAVFVAGAKQHKLRALSLLRQTEFWVYDIETECFGPSKFVAYTHMDFDRYNAAIDGAIDGDRFDGNVARLHLEQVLGANFDHDVTLIDKVRRWAGQLLGDEAIVGVDVGKWRFLRAPVTVFKVGDKYSRQDIYRMLQVPESRQGGNWDTGYTRYNDQWFIFANVGVAGRTGHDYQNRWDGEEFCWYGKAESRLTHNTIQSMVSGTIPVHIFTRSQDRSPFTYEGVARVRKVDDQSPVHIRWYFPDNVQMVLAEEITSGEAFHEGAAKTVLVNVYERNPAARRRCIEHHGLACAVCGLVMSERYGSIAEGFIHVHHLKQISDVGAEYEVDPVNDLRPVCPNCHAVLHLSRPPLSIEELQAVISERSQ